MKIAWDVDDTLIIPGIVFDTDRDAPNYEVIAIFKWFQAQGHDMVIWSGGGMDYAKMWADKLGLVAEIREKTKSPDIDLAFDDCDVNLAKINIKVKRIRNQISRKEWNKHKP